MKTYLLLGIMVGTAFFCDAQSISSQQAVVPPPTPYAITAQDANSRIWSRTVYELDPSGKVVPRQEQYHELASGLNHLVNGQYMASSEEINILLNGTAVATNGQHQASFPGDIYQGEIQLLTPDGQLLQSRPLALAYFDGTNTVVIAELTNSVGLVGNNQVTYPNAFTGFRVDLRYEYTKAGFSQDIILRQQPPTPESLGLNPDTARLQIMTEFFSAPQPTITSTALPIQAGVSLDDESLDFGTMQMVPGRAFLMGQNAQDAGAMVSKHWLIVNGRQVLIEEVPVDAILEGLAALPLMAMNSNSSKNSHTASRHLTLPPQRLVVQNASKAVMLAKVKLPAKGFVMDYQTVNGTLTNYTFRGDTTYYISGAVNLTGTNNTFEGGTVIKDATNASISVAGINWLAAPYRPVIFTAKDDNTVGDTISGSTGNPTNYYANPALSISTSSQTISSFRISYAQQAISTPSASINFYDGQFVNCSNGLTASSAIDHLRNVLFTKVTTDFNSLSSATIDVQNGTFANSTNLATVSSSATLNVTNCILASVTNLSGATVPTLNGGYNGFYASPPFGTVTNGTLTYPFQTVGAGMFYLTNGSGFQNVGTPNIDPVLLASLYQKTTYAPILYSNITVSINTNLSLQAQRDTGTPDLGYHYDPIDYLVDQFIISNATLTLTNGVAIGGYNGDGLVIEENSSIISIGSPLYPNWLVRYSSVQEQPIKLGSSSPSSAETVAPFYVSVAPIGQFRFTKFSCPAGGGDHLFHYEYNFSYSNLLVQDCEFWSGANFFGGNTNTVTTLKNNLFARSVFWGMPSDSISISHLYVTNNLFWGVSLILLSANLPSAQSTNWCAFNNDFDSCTGISSGSITNGYNAYLNSTGYITPTNTTDIFTNVGLVYQAGPLGIFYQPTTSRLINKGSVTANLVGLYQYTVITNLSGNMEIKETNSIVDIGYHYVATDQYGNPIDTNGDGIPDYLQDANGNGLNDSGETSWNLGIAVQPQSTNVVQGQSVTFSVMPSGIGPFTYQWFSNTVAISWVTNSTFTKLVVLTNDAANYSVTVSNATAGITSSIANLTVVVPLSITNQPIPETVLQGATTNFTVGVSGTTPVYQWYTNSVALVNNVHISGVNGNLLTIVNVMASDAANYWAIITNLAGSISSSTATLTVITPPNITSAPGNQTNVQATDASFSVAATGIGLAYQWQFNGTNIAGATNSTYTKLVVQTNNAGTYSVMITNATGSVTNNATLTVIVPPFFTQQPSSVITNQGSTASFSVTAIGTTNLVYQWFKNRTNVIAGATTTNLALANVQASNAAGYSILVTNNVGTNFSAWAWLSVIVGGTTNYGWGTGSSPPSFIPMVSMISPTNALANNAKVFLYGSPISIRALASSQYGYITNVIFYFTGTNYGTNFMVAGTAVPGANTQYALAWTNAFPGTNIVRAVAWDNSGLSSNSTVVYVIMAVPPTISAGPNTNVVWTEGSSGTNILMKGVVSSNGLPYSLVTNAQWSVISGNGSYATISNPNSLVTPINFTTNGTFVMQLRVDNNFATNFQTCTVTIQRRPFVTLTSPTNNTTVLNGTPLALNATASSLDSTISTVKFYTNGVLLGAALPSAGNTYALLWPNTYPWTNSVSTVATDARGLTSTSTVSVIILPNLTVQFVSPTSGQFFAFSPTNILLAALPASHVGSMVTSVTFSNQFMSLGSGVLTNSNYQVSWQYVTNGNYTLYVTAWDNSGNVATSSVAITVNSMPVVNILTPTSLQPFLSIASPTLTAGAYDPDFGDSITNVVFYGNGTNLPFVVTHSSTNWSLTWTNLSTGAYPITAIATDNHGASHSSATRIFRVNAPSPAPMVAITSPANYTSFNAWPDVTITANTFSSLGAVARVDFYNGTNYLGTDLTPYITSGSTNFEVTLSGLKPGSYSLTAVVTDTASPSRSTTSLPINITVGNSLPPNPTAGYWDPAFGDFDTSARRIILALQFDSTGNLFAGGWDSYGEEDVSPLLLHTDCAWTPDFIISDNDDNVEAITIDGTNVYAAGDFTPIGSTRFQGVISPRTGLNTYLQIGNNLYFDPDNTICDTLYGKRLPEVQAIHMMNGNLYIGGDFNGTVTNVMEDDVDTNVQFIATLTGNKTNWSAVGASMLNGRVRAIADLNGTLYIGGDFTNVGPNGASYLAKLTNGDWQPVGFGVNGRVCALTAHNDRLFVGGEFTTAGGLAGANLIACWDGTNWSSINNGLSVGLVPPYDCEVTNRVAAIAARGDEIYVTGHFAEAWNGSSGVNANNIARAVWNEVSQSWQWFALGAGLRLDDGVDDTSLVNGHAIIINDLGNGTGYEVIVGGYFDLADNLPADNIARWVVGQSDCPTNGPSICFQNLMPYQTVDPESGGPGICSFFALATTTGSNSISDVAFYLDGVPWGTAFYLEFESSYFGSDRWELDVTNLALGQHTIQAVVTDSMGLSAASVPIPFITSSGILDPVPNSDTYYVTSSGLATNVTLPVLINDSGLTSLHIIAVTNQNYFNPLGPNNSAGGTFTIDSTGTNLVYHANANSFGVDVASYYVADSAGTNSTWVTVNVQSSPQVQIYQPTDGWITHVPANFTLLGATMDADSTVESVQFYVNNSLYGSPIAPDGSGNFSLNWRTNATGTYTFKAEATDYNNITNFSPTVTVTVTNITGGGDYGTNPPVAVITSPLPPVTSMDGMLLTNALNITNSQINNLTGSAYDPSNNAVSWQILLVNPNDPDGPGLNVTPGPLTNGFHSGAVTNGSFGTVDLSTVENGAYILTLLVQSSGGQATAGLDLTLNSNLKLGQFSFSQQDIVIPVNGIPLTVTRTYNSQNQRSSDFGYGWTYSLEDMDVQLDEQRQDWQLGSDALPIDVNDSGDDDGSGPIVSIRSGGNRDVTLTLPDGRRTTFQFYFNQTGYNYNAMWRSSPGVNYTLTANNNPYFDGLLGYWNDVFETSFDNYDFQGFILLDKNSGTQYMINRGVENDYYFDPAGTGNYIYTPVFGPPQLTQIAQRSGATINIEPSGIYYYDTNNGPGRAIAFVRDPQGRIIAISDPNASSSYATQVPTLKYIYNQTSGNLVQVLKLVNSTSGLYSTNTFQYGNSNFPHYITEIDDPSGTPAARNFYDASGRLTAVVDANGKTNQFIYLTNSVELTVDPLGHTNAYVYDSQGNVTAQTNALGQIKTMAYDASNNKTNDVTFLNGQPYATNKYVYDLNLNQITTQTDPLGRTTSFTYDDNNFGNLLTSTDARNNTTINVYDGSGNLTNSTDALNNSTFNFYSVIGLPTGSKDAIGTASTNYYDGSENLIATATLDISGKILSTNTFTYDNNANRLTSTVWRHVGSGWAPSTTTYNYDAQNRVIQTIDPDGGTNTVVYNVIGKQQATSDALGDTTSYTYDALARLIQTAYPDTNTESSAYDVAGNRTNSVDRAGRITTYIYDALNRLQKTIYADNTTNSTVYDGVGRVAQSIDARGTTTGFSYDVAGRRLAVTNAVGTSVANTNLYSYDANGNQITFTDGLNHTTTNVFDALNRQVQVQYPDGTKILTGYDADGRRVAQTNQDGLVTKFGYDGAGRLISVTDALNQITSYQYDEAGNQTIQIDALNRTNTYAYDSMGRRIQHIMPGNQTESFSYDLGGNLTYQTNFNNVIITNQYDVMNRLTNRSSANGYKATFAYSATGQRTNMVDASGTNGYSYDNRDRLTSKAVAFAGGPSISLNYGYDANGNLTNLWSSTPNGVTNYYQYDALNRLTNVLANGGEAAGYAFDNVGNLQTLRYGNGVTNLYQYDSLNRLTNSVWKLNASTLGSFYYQLGLSGNRTNLSEAVNGSSRGYSWKYDILYRLTNETVSTTAPTGTLGYGYDAVGNRTNRTGSLGSLGSQAQSYNTNDWLSSDTNDNNGNTTASGPNSYQYDVENHLTNFNSGAVLIGYDGDGNRVKKIKSGTTTYYLLDDINPSGYVQVLEEYQGSTLSRVYNYGLSLISQRQVSSGTVSYYGYDGHGSIRFLTSASGSMTDTNIYDAYGTLIASTGTTPNNYLYCGQQFDSDLSLYLNRARYLNTGTGRFLTSDSTDGDNEDPLSLHKYLYGADNPVNNSDPSGHDITADELKQKLNEGGNDAMEGVSDALNTIANGGEAADAVSGVLGSVGPAVVADILYSKAYNAVAVAGQRLQIQKLYPLARAGSLDPHGPIATLLESKNAFQVEYNHDDFSSVSKGIAPLDITEESGKWVPFFVRWNDLGQQMAAVSLFPIKWDKNIRKFGPDLSHPFGFNNIPASVFFHSTGYTFTLDLSDDLSL